MKYPGSTLPHNYYKAKTMHQPLCNQIFKFIPTAYKIDLNKVRVNGITIVIYIACAFRLFLRTIWRHSSISCLALTHIYPFRYCTNIFVEPRNTEWLKVGLSKN